MSRPTTVSGFVVAEQPQALANTSAPLQLESVPRGRFEDLFASVITCGFGVALRYTRNQADAEDLVQEAALLAHRAFDSFESGTNFRAWFLKILTNCYFSKRRREKRRPVTSDLDDTPDLYLYARSGQAGFPTQGPDPAADPPGQDGHRADRGGRSTGCPRSTGWSALSTSWRT